MSSTASFCHYYNQNECKSCKWIEIPYTKQVEQKEDLLRQALSFLSDFTLEKTVVSKTLGFRNKAKMVVTGSVENPVIGLAGDETLDQGKEILACPIQHPKLNELIQALPKYIHEFNLIPYQIKSREGELKGLILFYSENSNQLYLRFVLRSKECVSRIQKLLPRLQGEFPNLVCVSANIQPVPHAILEGKEEIFVTSRKEIDLDLGRVKLKLSPRAFVQTHTELAKELYGTATSWIAETKPKLMVELFCGQGAFSFFAAGVAEKIIGVELNADAVTTANATAKELGLHHELHLCRREDFRRREGC
jgi:23S rRNA (uracil747-C5)-methyltransferase